MGKERKQQKSDSSSKLANNDHNKVSRNQNNNQQLLKTPQKSDLPAIRGPRLRIEDQDNNNEMNQSDVELNSVEEEKSNEAKNIMNKYRQESTCSMPNLANTTYDEKESNRCKKVKKTTKDNSSDEDEEEGEATFIDIVKSNVLDIIESGKKMAMEAPMTTILVCVAGFAVFILLIFLRNKLRNNNVKIGCKNDSNNKTKSANDQQAIEDSLKNNNITPRRAMNDLMSTFTGFKPASLTQRFRSI
jgi:hypothetical protein